MTEAEAPRIRRIDLTPTLVPFRAVLRETMASAEGGLGMAIAAERPWLGGAFVIYRLIAEGGARSRHYNPLDGKTAGESKRAGHARLLMSEHGP